MKYRAFALGAAVTTSALGLLPATAMAASAATATGATTTPVTTMTTGPSATASASSRNAINIDVVTQLPRGDYWRDGRVYDRGGPLTLPYGYTYRDGGIVGPDRSLYMGPDPLSRNGAVIDTTATCKGSAYSSSGAKGGGWIAQIADQAIKACAGVITAAYNVIGNVAGSGEYKQC
jgi:hypothetical protein